MNMKIFITLELEGKDDLQEQLSEKAHQRLMDTVDLLRKQGIPVQYKETNIPRRYEAGFVRASELSKLEE